MTDPQWLSEIRERVVFDSASFASSDIEPDQEHLDNVALLRHVDELREALEPIRPFLEAIKDHEFNGKYPGKALYGFNGVNLTFDMLNGLHKALQHDPTKENS